MNQDDQSCDQFITSCLFTDLRKKLLTESNLSLQRLICTAKSERTALIHNKQIEANNNVSQNGPINNVSYRPGKKNSYQLQTNTKLQDPLHQQINKLHVH